MSSERDIAESSRQDIAESSRQDIAESSRQDIAKSSDPTFSIDGVECLENRLINHFFHDFKGNLSTVIMCLEAMNDGVWGPLTPEQEVNLQRAERSCQHMVQLINNYRDMTLMEEGTFPDEPGEVDVAEVFAAIRDRLGPVAKERGQTLELHASTPLPTATLRAALLERVLFSLYGVLIDNTRRGGHILTEIYCHAEELRIDVSFEGVEVPSGELGSVFDKLGQTLKGLQLGRGFTLLFCKQAASFLGGRLGLKPWPGHGNRVELAIPLSYDTGWGAGRSSTTNERSEAMDKKGKIFMIDDDADLVMVARSVFENADYEFASAGSAEEGLEKLDEVNPSLIILDVMMEDQVAGFRVANTLRLGDGAEKYGKIPILMLTSVQQRTKMRFSRDAGSNLLPVDSFVEKPVKPSVLLDKVAELLAKAAARS